VQFLPTNSAVQSSSNIFILQWNAIMTCVPELASHDSALRQTCLDIRQELVSMHISYHTISYHISVAMNIEHTIEYEHNSAIKCRLTEESIGASSRSPIVKRH